MQEYINRPPRIQPELPSGEYEIPSPPAREAAGAQSLIQVAIPLIMILGYVLVGSRGGSILFVLPMALSVLATSAVAVMNYLRTLRIDRERQELYKRQLVDIQRQIIAAHDKQRAFYLHNYPDMDTVTWLAGLTEGHTSATRLWERRTDDNDFGAVRLGMGTMPSTVVWLPPTGDSTTAPQFQDAVKLSEDSRLVHNIPIPIPLRPRVVEDSGGQQKGGIELGVKLPAIGRYAIGIAGKERKPVSDFVRALLVNFATFHSPNDTRLYVIGASDSKADWDWARWLPHCNTSRQQAGRGDLLAFDPNKVRRTWDSLQNELQKRLLRSKDEDAGDVTLPFLVIVVDGLSKADDSPLKSLNTEAAISLLLTHGATVGAAVVFIVPERDQIPSECRAVVEAEMLDGVLTFRYAEIGLNTLRYDGAADVIDVKTADQEFARKLAPKVVRATFGADIATSVNLLELFSTLQERNYVNVNEFPILDWWRKSRKSDSAEWLQAPIGLMAGNKVRSITFAADGDGSHGLVAGTTGSGKSELLLTLVVGLAMRYDPSVVNFVLADYKGGTAFDPFKPLPHAVDIVSNLQGLAGARTFTATKAEMNRRSALLAATNTKHIVDYRKRGLHERREPFPFLFIIVDEFAEMVKENPEFKGNLDSITRLGRALGISLILATQRPAGVVTDQMRSNIKWRICLRVETAEDSRELLKRSDAAFLPNNIPGRGYIQVGNDNVELMQVARAGAPYTGDQERADPPVIWRGRGTSSVDLNKAKGPAAEAPAISDLLVGIMARLAAENEDVAPQKKPWPDPLPTRLTLDQERLPSDIKPNPLLPLNGAIIDWLEGEGGWHGIDWTERAMRANIGLIDHPIQAKQMTLTIDFTKGHAVVFGSSGWGKTILLRTLVTTLCATHSPQELNVYMMDFGGKGLDVLTDLPHVASSVLPSEDERVQALLRRIYDELDQRKALLSQTRTDTIYQYNAAHPEKPVPAMLIVIDNFAEFRENYENLLPELTTAVRDGRGYGIHFILTSQQPNSVPNKLFNMITERMTFRLPEPSDYAGVVGRTQAQLPEIPGRGFVQVEGEPLEMQVALPVGVTQDDEVAGLDNTKKLGRLIKVMKDWWGDRPRPQSIDLVKVLSLMDLFSFLDKREYQTVEEFPIVEWWRESRKPTRSEWIKAPLGLVTGNKVRSIIFDQNIDGVHGIVAGTTGSGKSELLLTLVAGVAMRYDPSVVNFILADYKGGAAFDPFRGLPHAVDIVSNLQGMAGARTFTAMRAEMNRRSALLAASQTKHIVEYRQRNLHETREPFPFLFIIVDEFAEMVKENPEFKGNLDSITRLGRALGMCLILATQRPAGVVTDQMRSNMKWRVCLRVETPQDSRELLKREDAAYLPNSVPGRGYIQIGNDNIELMQVARAGGPYSNKLPDYLVDDPAFADAPALSNVMTAIMKHHLETLDEVKEQVKPYPDPLPRHLTLDQARLAGDIKPNPLMPLNPAIIEWAEGRGDWHGINWAKNSMRANIGLIDNPARAEQIPLTVNLNRGHAVVFGSSGWGKTIMLRTLVTGLAATHSPKELHVYMVDFGGKGLDVLTDLPHVACSILPSEDDRVQALLRRLNDELDTRKQLLSQARTDNLAIFNSAHPDRIVPAILVVIDNFAEFRENYDSLIPELMSIVRDGRAYGIHFVVTSQQTNALPSKLYNMFSERMVFRMTDVSEYQFVVGRNMPNLPEIAGRGFIPVENEPLEMQVALVVSVTEGEAAEGVDNTKKLGQIVNAMKTAWGERPRPQSVDLVRQLSLMELFAQMDKTDYRTVMDFPILEWWERSRKPEAAEWLRAPVGLVTGNKVRALIFDQQIDGVHGMVAGTTGSGKSELLLTVVAGLAMRYDPSVVNFILADYKGGSAFDPFKGLPHAVDIVTNLQGLAGARTFTAMKAEMNRRSKLLADTQTKHVVDYRKRNLHERREPFPFLFIIVDEFAEMVKENPEFKGSLDSITRLGRALGVCLILATQRPAGVVTDQMRSNMKWRICLRVETGDDSKELLKRADAAFLPNNIPGRAFLQVGNDNLELMQVARAGGPYNGPLPDYLKQRYEEATEADEIFLSNVLTAMMAEMARAHTEIKPQSKPYPDPLPLRLTLDQPSLPGDVKPNPLLPLSPATVRWLTADGGWHGIDWQKESMRVPIGLVDNPIQAEQRHLMLNLARGHAVLFGASGYGKTVALRTAVIALAVTHSPLELNIYLLDLGGKGLDVLGDLPHVSSPPINAGQDERIQRLLRRLGTELESRKAILSQVRADNLPAYNTAQPDKMLPAILLVIDNFAEFKENYEALLPDLIGLAREGRAYGIHLLISADQPSAVPNKLVSLFTERMTLKLTDAGEYMNVVGRGVPGVPEDAGRGFVSMDRMPLEMHVALPVSLTEADTQAGLDDTKKLAKFVATLAQAWGNRPRPSGIDILRTIIPLRSVIPARSLMNGAAGGAERAIEAILGIEDTNLEPAAFDLAARGPHFILLGPPLAGKTTALRSWILSLAAQYDPSRVMMVLVDFRRRLFNYGKPGKNRSLAELPHVVAAVTDAQGLNEAIANLKAEYETPDRDLAVNPRPEIFLIADNYDDFATVIGNSTASRSTAYRDLAELANKYGPEGFHAVLGGSTSIIRAQDEFMRRALESRYGLGLDSGEAASQLGGKLRAGNVEFPPGRGFIVRSGRVTLMQVATPQDDGGATMEESLDRWVAEIVDRYPTRAEWFAPQPVPTADGSAPTGTAPAPAPARATAPAPVAQAAGTPSAATGTPADDYDVSKVLAEAEAAKSALDGLDAMLAAFEKQQSEVVAQPFNAQPTAFQPKPKATTEGDGQNGTTNGTTNGVPANGNESVAAATDSPDKKES